MTTAAAAHIEARPLRDRIRSIAPRLRRPPLALGLLLLAAALQSIAWDVSLPPFQGPDEDAHFAYVQHLAETGGIPSSVRGNAPNSFEAGTAMNVLNLHPVMGDVQARPAWSSADLALWHRIERTLPKGARSDGTGLNPVAKNPPLYYAGMAIPYRIFVWLPLIKRLFVLRLFNALCFLATVAFTWMIAGDLFGGVRWKQTLAAGAVALEPQLAFMSAVVNADNLLIAVTTGFLLLALRLAIRGPTFGRVLAASAACAAAILTHGRGLVTVPVLCVAVAVAFIRHRPSMRDVLARSSAAVAVILGALGVDAAVSSAAAGGGSLYGGQVSNLNNGKFNLRQFLSFIYQFYLPPLPGERPRIGPAFGYRQVFIDTFYGTFGWLEVSFRQRTYDLLQIASALGLVALYTACVVRWRALWRAWGAVLVMLSLLVTLVVFLHYVSYRSLLGNGGSDPLIVGRYLLPMVSLFGLAIAFTVGSLPRRVAPIVGAVILSVGVLLALGGIGITAARFYG